LVVAEKRIFVGREDELKQFEEVLRNQRGEAVLAIGQAGMGKTWLLGEFEKIVGQRKRCEVVRYELTDNDSVNAVMERMMDDAFRAGEVVEGSFDSTTRRRKQWFALLETMVPRGEKIAKLIQSLRRESKRPTREEFLERLRLISGKMKDDGRAVFIIDPLEYLNKGCAGDWAIVIRDLPEKVKFVFAQREDDVLAGYRKFVGLKNVIPIPRKKLGALNEQAVDKLIKLRADETEYTEEELKEGLEQYKGHPYAVQGAVDLLQTGTKLEELPDDPTEAGVVEEQWEKVCGYGDEAIRMFKSYAILEEAVGDDIVEKVAEVETNARLNLLAKNVFLRRLLHEEGESKRIYHLLLANYILGRMSDKEKEGYHSRAVEVYRQKLEKAEKAQTKPDALAAMRLAEHVLEAEGKEAFVDAFVDECGKALMDLGLLDAFVSLSERALEVVEKGSKEEATVTGNLGLVYEIRGELDKAEEMHKKSLEIEEKLGRLEGIANQYGNLGLIYQRRGELEKAEELYNMVLKIEEKLGRPDSIANAYGNLGVIYMDRSDLDKAEEMNRKSLEINEKLGRLEGVATDYGNLGNVYYEHRELDKAEEMHKKSLEIKEKLGLQEGMANSYGNLGAVYKQRGDIEKAKECWEKAEDLCRKIGMPHMIEKVQGWIDELSEK